MIRTTKLYKVDSAGRLRILKIYTKGNLVCQESGLIDGKLAYTESVCVGKNIGRSNETTPEEQAELEAKSKITDHLKTEYFRTVEEALSSKVILPMLAKEFNKEEHKVQFPCWVQPKLDGMRCLGYATKMISRANTPITTMGHIQSDLAILQDHGGSIILDGELYAHGLSFQENMKLIKKARPESKNVKYHVYDMVWDQPFEERYARLQEITQDMPSVEIVPTFPIRNKEDLKIYHAQFLAEGYEGTIVRWGTDGYQINKRADCLLKYKDFLDVACTVIDIVPSEKRPEQGTAVCQFANGKTFQTGMKFSHAEREEILRNKHKYIGKTAELRFFEYTDEGLPRFPVCVGFRLDK